MEILQGQFRIKKVEEIKIEGNVLDGRIQSWHGQQRAFLSNFTLTHQHSGFHNSASKRLFLPKGNRYLVEGLEETLALGLPTVSIPPPNSLTSHPGPGVTVKTKRGEVAFNKMNKNKDE